MSRWISNSFIALFVLSLSACFPKHSGSGDNGGASSVNPNNLLSVTSVRTGSSGAIPNLDPQGRYYSRDPLYTVTGACRGSVQKIRISITPQSQSTTQEWVNCSSESFSWNKTFAAENFFAIQISGFDANGAAIPGLSDIQKTFVYDITPPTAPTFLSPTTSTSYTVTNGAAQITISGQVLNEVNYLIGPTGENVALVPNPDHVHQDYSYALSVPQTSTVIENFTALDYAGNSASIAMTVQSVINLTLPIASNELGGSSDLVDTGLFIHSSIGIYQGAVMSDHVQLTTGAAGMVGDMQ